MFSISLDLSSFKDAAAPSADNGTVASSSIPECSLQLGEGKLLVAECSNDLEAARQILATAQSLVKERRKKEEIKEGTACTCCLEGDLRNAMIDSHDGLMKEERYETILRALAAVNAVIWETFWVTVDMDLKL